MTFAVAARCSRTGMVGVAITTSSICVAARCPWVRAGVGAVATQNVTDPALGPEILDLLAGGKGAAEALADAIKGRPNIEHRQLAVIDRTGAAAHYTGGKTLGTNAVVAGRDCIAVGNLLATTEVPKAMMQTFEAGPELHLAERLLQALEGGLAVGGEVGPVHSAGLLVAHEQIWPLVDLRVDWHDDDPIAGLRRLWQAYQPQMADYVARALDPDAAASYGVPGDE